MMPRKHGHYGGLSQSKWIITLFDLFSAAFCSFHKIKNKAHKKMVSGQKTNLFFSNPT